MKKILTLILAIFAISSAFAYEDLINLIQMSRMINEAKYAREMQDAVRDVEDFYTLEKFADLKLWCLEQSQPKIFIAIATADNATDVGYFRLNYRKAGTFGKLGLLKQYFNLK